MAQSSSPENMVFDMAEKSTVKVNNSLTLNEVIINDANEWQKDVDLIWLVKKTHYAPTFGDFIEYSGNHYLSIFPPEEREIFWSSKVRLCNSVFPIQSNKTRDLLGYNPITNEPIYSEYKEVLVEVPCIVESKYSSTNNDGDTLTIPENELVITMKHYEDAEHVKENFEFEMYNQPYKIANIDSTKVISGKGIIKIIARRDV